MAFLRWLPPLFKVAAQLSRLIDKFYLNRILLVLDVIQFLSYCDIIFLTALAVSKTVFSKGVGFQSNTSIVLELSALKFMSNMVNIPLASRSKTDNIFNRKLGANLVLGPLYPLSTSSYFFSCNKTLIRCFGLC